MALSVEKLLTDAHMLITRLKGHDSLADGIIGNSQALFNKVEAMKQYQDDITELNEIAKHRPRSTLVLGIAQENRQIRQLQQENRELEASLEEHQSALELIMQKYREHTVKLLQTNQIERALKEKESSEKNSMCHLMDKIDEMAGVMQKAIEVDETSGCVDKERLRRMEVENKALREMLEICSTSRDRIVPELGLTPIKLPDELLEEKSESVEAEEESDSEADTSTLKRFKDRDEDDSDDVDSSTLKRQDNTTASSSSSKEKEDPKKEEKKQPVGADSKKKTETKKPDTLGKDVANSKESTTNRSGSKSPVSSKSTGDIKKSRVSSSPVKRTTSASSTSNKKESPSSSTSLKKTASLDSKKDTKSKAPAKSGAKK